MMSPVGLSGECHNNYGTSLCQQGHAIKVQKPCALLQAHQLNAEQTRWKYLNATIEMGSSEGLTEKTRPGESE
jgi:hypothetical protein